MKFTIKAVKPDTGEFASFVYDNITSEFGPEGSATAGESEFALRSTAVGKASPRVLKISLGLSCNYACEYCSQRFVPKAGETNPEDAAKFVAGMDSWVTTPPEKIEFWGGEPLVYVKTLVPLAEALRAKFPDASFSMVTNGSLLNLELNAWLDKLGFSIGLSHDGQGQSVRGPDPLEDAEVRSAILDLYKRLGRKRMSFNAMMHTKNLSRAELQRFFVELTGDPEVVIGEGGVIDAYDAGGVENSLAASQHFEYRNRGFHELRTAQAVNFAAVTHKVTDFANSIKNKRHADSVGQKCYMDKAENLAVDLNGNVLTCQNVSAAGVSPNGQSHKIGHVSDLAATKLATARHWSTRDECPRCPMLQICKGSCMFLEGKLWDASCNNAFSDAVPVFAATFEFLTGYVPLEVVGGNRPERHKIWEPTSQERKARVISISPV